MKIYCKLNARYIIILLFILNFPIQSNSQINVTSLSSTLDVELSPIEIKGQPLYRIIDILRGEYHLQIGFEEKEYDKTLVMDTVELFIDNQLRKGFHLRKKKIDLIANNMSIRQVLDELVKQDKDYSWDLSDEGIINVFPCSNNPQNIFEKSVINNIVFPDVNINTTINYVISSEIKNVLLAHGFGDGTHYSIGDTSQYDKTLVNIKMNHPSFKKFLNTIVKEAGPNFGWNIMGLKGNRDFSFTWHPITPPTHNKLLESPKILEYIKKMQEKK